jgi:hypothetical protein
MVARHLSVTTGDIISLWWAASPGISNHAGVRRGASHHRGTALAPDKIIVALLNTKPNTVA